MRNSRYRFTALLGVVFLLSACASQPPEQHLPLSQPDGTPIAAGIIVGSITAGSRYMNVVARFESSDGQGYYGKVQNLNDFGHSAREYALRYGNVFGDVFAIQLPAGDYAFTGWTATAAGTSMASSAALRPLPFTVAAGETRYIGNLHFPQLATRDAQGPRVPTSTWAIANNREKRDADALFKHHPELQQRTVVVQPLDPALWRADYYRATGDTLDDPLF